MKKILKDDLIFDYLDGNLSGETLKETELQMEVPENKARLEELKTVHAALQLNVTLDHPSRLFTQRVLKNLDTFEVKRPSARNGLLLFLGMVTATGITVVLMQNGVFDSFQGTIDMKLPVTQEWLKSPVPAFTYQGKTILRILLMIGMGLSFVILDRTILKPFFERRRNQFGSLAQRKI